jgi:hypothetical protein
MSGHHAEDWIRFRRFGRWEGKQQRRYRRHFCSDCVLLISSKSVSQPRWHAWRLAPWCDNQRLRYFELEDLLVLGILRGSFARVGPRWRVAITRGVCAFARNAVNATVWSAGRRRWALRNGMDPEAKFSRMCDQKCAGSAGQSEHMRRRD